MAVTDPTFVGQVASVTGAIVRVRLREDMPTTLILIQGESYRVGQVGGFFRLPLGYSSLYAVCTQVGADAAPTGSIDLGTNTGLETTARLNLSGYRWMTIVLFGEGVSGEFERGVGQYPTVGDEVHLVTRNDLKVIYGWSKGKEATISIGNVAAATNISADISLPGLVSRHSSILGSTGAGKSNLVTVLLESLSDGRFPGSRVIVIDPHGEYPTALKEQARVFRVRPDEAKGEWPLRVPFWALPFSELQQLTLGALQPNHEASIRDHVLDMKRSAVQSLAVSPPLETLTADSPVPFSIKQLWYELDRFERQTFTATQNQSDENMCQCEEEGNAEELRSDRYPAASPYNKAPYKNARKRNIDRQLDLMRSRLMDGRYSFLFEPSGGYEPDLDGTIERDLDALVQEWVGHDKIVTVFDVSGLPADVAPEIVGTMLRVVYDALFWAQQLPIGGRHQPLLIILDEAHRFIPEGVDSSARRTLSMIAKEGRKYGVGLMVVTQRPSEIDGGILSQCGSLIALRLTNSADRAKVMAATPDDLGGLVDQLPSLRTGEALLLGELLPIPSRVRIHKAAHKLVGDDPNLPKAWKTPRVNTLEDYTNALVNWRSQSMSAHEVSQGQDEEEVTNA